MQLTAGQALMNSWEEQADQREFREVGSVAINQVGINYTGTREDNIIASEGFIKGKRDTPVF